MTENIEQRTPEWFAARKDRITGSSVGAILNMSPFMKPDDVMRQMVREHHNYPREFIGNAATAYGTFHERIAIMDYEIEFDTSVIPTGFHTYENWLGASPDGLISIGGLIEIKCPYGQRDKNPPEFKSIIDQPHYYAQMQVQLFVTDRNTCDFYQWSAHGYKLEHVGFNQDWIDTNLPKLKAFYEDYLIQINNPIYLEPKRQQVRCVGQLNRYLMISEQIKELEIEKKRLLDEMVKLADGKDSDIDGHKLTHVTREGVISYAKAIKDLMPDVDLSAYKGKSTSYWCLS